MKLCLFKKQISKKSIPVQSCFVNLQSLEDIWYYINSLFLTDNSTGAQGNTESQKFLLIACVLLLKEIAREDEQTLQSVIKLLRSGFVSPKSELTNTTLDNMFSTYLSSKSSFIASEGMLYYDLFKNSVCYYDDYNAVISACVMKVLPHINYSLSSPLSSSATPDLNHKKISYEDSSQTDLVNLSETCVSDLESHPNEVFDKKIWEIGFPDKHKVVARIIRNGEEICLQIDGCGETEDFYSETPWYPEHHLDITKVIVGNGISKIGKKLFKGLTSLKEAIIGSEVRIIGSECFKDCYMLSRISFEESIAKEYERGEIGYSCFANCHSLEAIVLPDLFKKLDDRCFAGCLNLHEITLSRDVNLKAYALFQECSKLTAIINYDVYDGLNTLPEYFGDFLKLNNVVLRKFSPLKSFAFSSSPEYYFEDNSIYFSPFLTFEEFSVALKKALGEYVYDYFEFEINDKFENVYTENRFDLYRNMTTHSVASISVINSIFCNSKACFCYYLFNSYIQGKVDRPIEDSCVFNYCDFIKQIHSKVYAEVHFQDVLKVFIELIGEESEKKLSYSQIKERMSSELGESWSDLKIKSWIAYLIQEGWLVLRKNNGNIYSLKKQTSNAD